MAQPRLFFVGLVLSLVLSFAFAPAADAATPDAGSLWSGKVQPLLDVNCTKCHGLIEKKGGLQLDNPEAVMKGGEDGAVVVPGKGVAAFGPRLR